MAKRAAVPDLRDDYTVQEKVRKVDESTVSADDIGQKCQKSTAEHLRLEDAAWRQWGPYLSERQWGTVREDHSHDGNCWQYVSHDDAVYYAYQSGEDGLLGVCDDHAQLCLALALWNGKDDILKERLFGLAGHQGNHGEDVKELYFYRDSAPTHSYMRADYKYPLTEFPYKMLTDENSRRSLQDPEFELLDTGVFDAGFWNVTVEYAKSSPQDLLCRYTVCNQSTEAATLHVLPTLWFRNTWTAAHDGETETSSKPVMKLVKPDEVLCSSRLLGEYVFTVDCQSHVVDIIFTENETNTVTRRRVVRRQQRQSRQLREREAASHGTDEDTPDTPLSVSDNCTTSCHTTATVSCTLSAHSAATAAELSWLLSDDADCVSDSSDADSSADEDSDISDSSALQSCYTKDAFHKYVIGGQQSAVNADKTGTKCAAIHCFTLQPCSHVVVRCRLRHINTLLDDDDDDDDDDDAFGKQFDSIFSLRQRECNEFYAQVISPHRLTADEDLVVRQAFAGLCWSKQFYCFDGSAQCTNDLQRNVGWDELECHDVISMPDKWEFPWFAVWDLAFHMIPVTIIDPLFAKSQLLLLLSDRYQHPNGQLPAYEFNFSDVNPPVHAWSCLHVYENTTSRDVEFLRRCFHLLVPNFIWWINRKDPHGKCMFHGGFLGMDNVSCVDRSNLPADCTTIDQVDGSAWMAFYAVCMLRMAVELGVQTDSQQSLYDDHAVIYLKHFCRIRKSLNDSVTGLWDNKDSFYYDRLHQSSQQTVSLCIRSLVGLLPLIAVHVIPQSKLCLLPRLSSLLMKSVDASMQPHQAAADCVCLSLVGKDQLQSLLSYMLNEDEFLSPYGIRSLSKYHLENPFSVELEETVYSISYCPDESTSSMFGGNSNWRGPIWLCMNYLLLEAVDTYSVVCDDVMMSHDSQSVTLSAAAANIRRRLAAIFLLDSSNQRPLHAGAELDVDPAWRDLLLFYEYYNPDTGQGHGASHQTGWTALIASILLTSQSRDQ